MKELGFQHGVPKRRGPESWRDANSGWSLNCASRLTFLGLWWHLKEVGQDGGSRFIPLNALSEVLGNPISPYWTCAGLHWGQRPPDTPELHGSLPWRDTLYLVACESRFLACSPCGSLSSVPAVGERTHQVKTPADPARGRTLNPGLHPQVPALFPALRSATSPSGTSFAGASRAWRTHLGWQAQGRWVELRERRDCAVLLTP